MINKMKKYFGLLLVAIMVMGISGITFAMDQPQTLNNLSKEGISVIENEQLDEVSDEKNEEISPMAWPGSGSAPQVTSIQLYDYLWLENGNFGVILKVYGYGRDNTTFDGRKISWIKQSLFTDFGTVADGSYYTYDCGPITKAGKYEFKTMFTSTNFPYSQKSYSASFTFSN